MLVILTTHPIQYQTPIWQALAKDGRVPFEVWYLTNYGTKPSLDRDFGKSFAWDIDILSGYPHRFLVGGAQAAPDSFLQCRLRVPLRDLLRMAGATALWIQGWQVAAYWQAVHEARVVGIDVWLRGESNDLAPTPSWKRPLKQLALGHLFRQVNQFLYIGSANRRLYRSFGVPEACLHPAPYAVDNERFARQAAELRPRRMEMRRQWGIDDDAFCVLFCGKFIEKKRPKDLMMAADLLVQREPNTNVHLLFVGSGDLGEALRGSCDVVHDAEVGPLVRSKSGAGLITASFTGFLNQTKISQAYVAADCLVLPSGYGETWGLVVNEAMASGLSCLASDACGCTEDLVAAIEPRFSFPCGDVSAIADALSLLWRRQASRERQNEVLAAYSFQRTIDTVVGLAREERQSFQVSTS